MNKKKIEMNIALSNHDILNLLNNNCRIILYPDIHNYNSIDQILDPYDCCIILYESMPKYGHWCALIKTDENNIEYFNPYGGFPDNSLDYISNEFRKQSNQFYPYLSNLMYKSDYNINFNEFPFQQKKNDIKTCGRHCVVRVFCKSINIYQYKDILDKLCKKFKLNNYDEFVTLITSK